MAKEFSVRLSGFRELLKGLSNATGDIINAAKYGLARAAEEIADIAQQNVSGSPYNLAHDSWQIGWRFSKKYQLTAMAGYYDTEPSEKASGHWNMKFFERGTKERFTTGNGKKIKIAGLSRGALKGGYFMKQAGANAESIAQTKLEESFTHMLKRNGLM